MTETKKQKLNPKKQLIINAFTNGAPSKWRHPDDHSIELTSGIDQWIEYAKYAEKGKLNAIFIADHLTFWDVYEGPNNFRPAAKSGNAVPRIDPSAVVPALAAVTKDIGFGITFSTISEHPYLFHRRLASLDHVTGGRLGWNIVSSYLKSLGPQLLNGEPLPEHDERYVKTEEYLDVVYDLLVSSWRDDAVVNDKENGILINPDALRQIHHKGKYFDVLGPAIVQPTKQRFPVIIQAGTSKRGKLFAAENAEIIYTDDRDKENLLEKITEIRTLAKEKFGRDPKSIKVLIASYPIIGKTHEEAEIKLQKIKDAKVPLSDIIGFSGISGIDLSKFNDDDPVPIGQSNNNLRSTVEGIAKVKTGKVLTKKQIVDNYSKRSGSLFGSYIEVADEIERWVKDYDIDGLNLGSSIFPDGIKDIVDLLIPELQKRGIFHLDYEVPNGTFRENLYGEKGHTWVPKDHPAHDLRWNSGVPVEEFENTLKIYKEKRDQTRKNAQK